MVKLTTEEINELIETLKFRFEKNMNRHPDVKWEQVLEKLSNSINKVLSLKEMEQTGGDPDVVGFDKETNEYIFFDCSEESPIGRRNVCYDQEALESKKKFKPGNSAVGMAKEMGIDILNEEEYRYLQKLGQFDLKTSSWIKTPNEIRILGGAVFGDRRYDNVFIYHNGADSYYGVRGFRGSLRV
jgi:hypothetical protein